jgi:nitroreductase
VNACSCTIEQSDETRRRGSARELLQSAVAYAVLAPSSHNTQPWRFEITDEQLLLFTDVSRALPVADPDQREMLMSCGAALFNLRTVLQHWGKAVRVDLLPDAKRPDLLARITISDGPPGTDEQRKLVAAMGRRRTHREEFTDASVPGWLLDELGTAADREGAWLARLHGLELTHAAELVGRASRQRLQSSAFRRELASWLRPNWTRRPDGLPGYAFGFGWLKGAVTRLWLWLFDVSRVQSRRDARQARRAPALAVLGTEEDTQRGWLAAGQALQRVLLTAATHGVSASFLNAPVHVAQTRGQLLGLTGRRGAPQVVLRIGYGGEVRPTPRRVPTEVIGEVA